MSRIIKVKQYDLFVKNLLKSNTIDELKIIPGNKQAFNTLLEQGLENAFVYLQRAKKNQKLNILEENSLYKTLIDLQIELNLPMIPNKIECYDISHLSGKFVYGSCSVFVEGKPAKKLYRLYKCKDQNDDYSNHKEVLRRRLKHTESGFEYPDLIVVDGGVGQLSSDYSVLKEYGLNIPIISIAKREELIFTLDHFQYPSKAGYKLSKQVNFLLERIRDEAHRFGITANRQKRLKTITKTSLDNIPGVGPKTIELLMTTFGSFDKVLSQINTNETLVKKLIGQKKLDLIKKNFNS
jgi:excinuclease ABC subunit C